MNPCGIKDIIRGGNRHVRGYLSGYHSLLWWVLLAHLPSGPFTPQFSYRLSQDSNYRHNIDIHHSRSPVHVYMHLCG